MSADARAVLVTLLIYKVLLIAIGLWASRRTTDTLDFFLGGRRLGGLVAGISGSASSSSAWTLLGVSGAACAWGLPALWLFPATLLGFLVNWLWVAPRLMELSRRENAVTLTDVIAGPGGAARPWIVGLSSCIIVFSFLFYIAAQFQAAGHAFVSSFEMSMSASVLVGAGIIVLYTLLGGFWAVSVTDTLQGLLMAATAIVLPLVALFAVGGIGGLASGLDAARAPADLPYPAGSFVGAAGFVLGTLGIGLGYPGQPHVVNRFMALGNRRALTRGRVIAIGWALVVYAGMLLVGLSGRVLYGAVTDSEQIFFEMAHSLLPPVASGIMLAAVLSAIMSTADSQLLVAGSAVTHDWRPVESNPRRALLVSRIVVFAISGVAVALALYAPQAIFSRVLFAWHAVGSAFGPVLVLRLLGMRIRPPAILGSLAAGFGLTVVLHAFPDAPGDAAERLLPLAFAFAIAWLGRVKPAAGPGI
ncbi:MAG TPA: sodium/proline symporter [Gammaproteobacteria bacterium]|nr:sodium/proline symporter [Gammaproteobacteria bacterium]